MAEITLGGNPCRTVGTIPTTGEQVKDFELTDTDMGTKNLAEFKGQRLVMNIFPSVDTGVCAASIRRFNEEAGKLEGTKVLCISRDLPFAQKRFCGAEGLDNVINLSDFKSGSFGRDYQLTIEGGPFDTLHSRVVIVTDQNGVVLYSEQVPEIGQEPDYAAALNALG